MRKAILVCSIALNFVVNSSVGAHAEMTDNLLICRKPEVIGAELDDRLENANNMLDRRAARAEAKVKLAACARDAIVKELPIYGSMRSSISNPANATYANSLALFIGTLQDSKLPVREAVLLETLLEIQDLSGDASVEADFPVEKFFSTYDQILRFKSSIAQDQAARAADLFQNDQTDRK